MFTRIRPWVLSRVRSNLGPGLRQRVQSEDCVQEVFYRLWRALHGIKVGSEDEIKALLTSVIPRVIMSQAAFYKAEKRDMGRDMTSTPAEEQLADDPTPSSSV